MAFLGPYQDESESLKMRVNSHQPPIFTY